MSTVDILPAFAGSCSFLRAPFGTIGDLHPGAVVVLGIPHEGAGSFRQGTREGPRSIREASVDFAYELQSSPTESLVNVDTGVVITLPDRGKLIDLGDFRIRENDIPKTCLALKAEMSKIMRRGSLPIILGGDHFITYPLLQGFCDALHADHKDKIGYMQVSSQFDLAKTHDYWGPHWHGATARRILDSGLIDPSNAAWIGIHGLVPAEEWEAAHGMGATVVTSHILNQRGVMGVVQQLREGLCSRCDSIYLSVDIGVVDGAEAPGRRELTVGGLRAAQLLELLSALAKLDIRALDLTEVAPSLDPVGRTQRLAAEAILSFIASRVLHK